MSDPEELRSNAAAATPESAARKRPKSARGDAFGILNPYGDVWTYDHFDTEQAARDHLDAFWKQSGFGPRDLSRFKVVPVSVTVSTSASTLPSEAEGKA